MSIPKIPKNTWHCSVCNFYVFNTKARCNKCLTQKQQTKHTFSSYDPVFDEQLCTFFQKSHLHT